MQLSTMVQGARGPLGEQSVCGDEGTLGRAERGGELLLNIKTAGVSHLLLFCWELITENDKMRPLKTLSLFPLKLLFLPDLGKAEVFCLLGGCRAKGSFGGERKGHEVATLSMKVIPFPAIASANWGSTPLAW